MVNFLSNNHNFKHVVLTVCNELLNGRNKEEDACWEFIDSVYKLHPNFVTTYFNFDFSSRDERFVSLMNASEPCPCSDQLRGRAPRSTPHLIVQD